MKIRFSYQGLWDKLRQMNISIRTLTECCNLSAATVSHINNGEAIQLTTIERIADYLKCDYGDIISKQRVSINEYGSPYTDSNKDRTRKAVMIALPEYSKNERISARQISLTTGLALNTIKSILSNERTPNTLTCEKLYGLGDIYRGYYRTAISRYIEMGG